MTSVLEDKAILDAVRVGAINYLLKDTQSGRLCEATVKTHVSNILGKLSLPSRTRAALYALKIGLVSLDEADLDA